MDILIAIILFTVPFQLASLIRRAAKGTFPVWECCVLGAELVGMFYFLLYLAAH